MRNRFTPSAQNAIQGALTCAKELGHTYIGSEHLLLGILKERDCAGARLLEARGITASKTQTLLEDFIGVGIPCALSADNMTPRTRRILEQASNEAARFSQARIATEHLLYGILRESDCAAVRFLLAQGVSIKELQNDLSTFLETFSPTPNASFSFAAGEKRSDAKGKAPASPHPTISQYGRDLTALFRHSDPVIGREEETERLIRILCRKTKNNPCLIGEPGVGKTAVVEGLAHRIAQRKVPEPLLGKSVYMLDLSAMVAGAKYRGEFEDRMKNLLAEAIRFPSLILFIDEIHTMIGAGAAEGAVDAANILKPSLARGEIQVIGATTITEYRRHIEKDAALERRFQPVMIEEPTKEQAVEILKGLRPSYEAHHKIKITDEAIDAAVSLSVRYLHDRFLPDKAIDLMDEAASAMRIRRDTQPPHITQLQLQRQSAQKEKEAAIRMQDFEAASRSCEQEQALQDRLEEALQAWALERQEQNLTIGRAQIEEIITSQTAIPVKELEEDEQKRLLELESLLHRHVIGQEEAICAIAKTIRRCRVGLQDPNRPNGSFLFLGPTGVGKTEIAKALAQILFGTQEALIRIDMSEYMEKHSVSKLIGSPPGYIGYEQGGQLTEKIRRHPYCVLLFDEVEKAHPDLFHLLLQVLEDGILTDAQGRRVNCRNCIILLTSNIGAQAIASKSPTLGFSASPKGDAVKEKIQGQLKEVFRPEFLNRLDEIVYFKQLSETETVQIVEKLLGESAKRILDLGVSVRYEASVAPFLANKYYDPVYGARPLRAALRRSIEDPFAELLLQGRVTAGSTVTVSVKDEALSFQLH